MENKIEHKRDITLDAAKGFAIVMVVLGHALQYSFGKEWETSLQFYSNPLFEAIYSFHMPLFMLISGYLFYNSNKNRSASSLVLSKLKRIGIPMVSFLLLCNSLTYLRLLLNGEIVHLLTNIIIHIYHGMTLWFLFSLLLNMLIVALITRVFRSRSICYSMFLLVFILSLFIPDSVVLAVHKFMFPFFCIGYVVKESGVDIYKCSGEAIWMGILTLISIACIIWFDKDTLIYSSGFCILRDGAYQLFIDGKRLLIGLIVSFTVLQYVHLVTRRFSSRLFMRLGMISLFIYGINVFFDNIYIRIFDMKGWSISFNYLVPLMFTVVVVSSAVLLHKVVVKNRLLSFLFLGK